MKKEKLIVPQGVKYISEWKDYVLPRGEHFIIDKGVTGCGYTEMCLTNDDNVVLCSPRKLLLENKSEQHEGDENILYLINNGLGFKDMTDRLEAHLRKCQELGKPVKIMVTYDSAHYVSDFLIHAGKIQDFIFVIDEFQSIFLDSYFKMDTELRLVEELQGCINVIYLSATPMLDEYLEMMPEFKDLQFQHLDWSETGNVENVKIQRKRTSSLGLECNRLISDYLRGNYNRLPTSEGNIVESREAVFYFNSLEEIIRIIKKNKLTPENTLVLCSDAEENMVKLKKIGFKVGKIPTRGKPYPMFTFCTSAVYMGIDFYSDCASSFVFADPNINSLALDISLDLPQIIGRQRNRNNLFKNNIVIFYKLKREDEFSISLGEYNRIKESKRSATKSLLNLYAKGSEDEKIEYKKKLERDIEGSNYSGDYVGISYKTGQPIYNSLIDIADDRAWKVSQVDYQDSLVVTKALDSAGYENSEYASENGQILKDFLDNYFYSTGLFHEKMKLYCDFRDKYGDREEILEGLNFRIKDSRFKNFYEYYGTQGCAERRYRENLLYQGLESNIDDFSLEIHRLFKEGEKYTNAEIKECLTKLYSKYNINLKAKATDLQKYFGLKKALVNLEGGVRVHGFELLPL